MGAIVESANVTVERRQYTVAGWGVGELWVERDVVVAHDFDFARPSEQGRVGRLGTKATFLDGRPDAALADVTLRDREPHVGTEPTFLHAPNGRGGLVGDVVDRVRAFLRGRDVVWDDIALDLDWCTPFQREVIGVLRRVPLGEVVSYGEVAALAG